MARGRPKKIEGEKMIDTVLEEVKKEKLPIEEMPLETMRDYRLYNEEARKLNKKLRMCRYPIKPCPVELHPKIRVKFQRMDQPSNPLPVYKSDDIIDFKETLIPGQVYDLPEYIVHYLSEKGNPVWERYTKKDGSEDTRMSHKIPKYSLQKVWSYND